MARDGLYVGLMSGTSMDGIDAALIRLRSGRPRLLHALAHPWPHGLAERLRRLSQGSTTLTELGELDHLCGLAFAAAAERLLHEAAVEPAAVTAIGSHGQTIHHRPSPPAPFTLQIGDPNLIAQRTGITTVADFRRRDMAAEGQGAPLVPRFHQALFAHERRNRVVLNIGGIANITVLPAGREVSAAFDTGPGNCLMDAWYRRHREEPYDRDGDWAATGAVVAPLLQALLQDPYFPTPPPKSTGTEHFSLAWLDQQLEERGGVTPRDVQATLLKLTVVTIADAIERWAPATEEVLVCGGGRRNRRLMKGLEAALPGMEVRGTETEGADPDWIEAMAFAWLAAAALAGEPGNLPAATGAREEVVLGAIYPALS